MSPNFLKCFTLNRIITANVKVFLFLGNFEFQKKYKSFALMTESTQKCKANWYFSSKKLL